jgi:PAS domain S-box-containing protein
MEERSAGQAPSADWVTRVIEAAPDAVITIDSSARVILFNRAAERMFGFGRGEAIGRLLDDLVAPPGPQAAQWADLLGPGAGETSRILDQTLELGGLRRHGRAFPVQLTLTQTSEAPPVWTGFIRDLSGHRDAQCLLARAEQLAQMGSWELDLRSLDAVWSDGLYRIHRLEPEAFEPSVERVLELIHADDFERTSSILSTVVETPERIPEEGVTVEYRVKCGDGTLRALRARGRVERDDGGRPARWVGVAQDVTTERQARVASVQRRARPGTAVRRLSNRELEVLGLAAEGNTGPQIATRLSLSPATVKTHFENLYEKLGVSDRAAAVAQGLRTGLIH